MIRYLKPEKRVSYTKNSLLKHRSYQFSNDNSTNSREVIIIIEIIHNTYKKPSSIDVMARLWHHLLPIRTHADNTDLGPDTRIRTPYATLLTPRWYNQTNFMMRILSAGRELPYVGSKVPRVLPGPLHRPSQHSSLMETESFTRTSYVRSINGF